MGTGRLSFDELRETLRGCQFDDAKRQVLLPTPETESGGVYVVVDFDDDDIDVKVALTRRDADADAPDDAFPSVAFELSCAVGEVGIVSRSYAPPRPWKPGATLCVTRQVQLDDVPFGIV